MNELQPTPARVDGSFGGMAAGVVEALRASPVLLLIVLLNGFFVAAAGYYLLQVEAYRAADRSALISLLDRCASQTVPMDYLLRRGDTRPSPP